jgi:hypothetical protein
VRVEKANAQLPTESRANSQPRDGKRGFGVGRWSLTVVGRDSARTQRSER